MPGSRILTEAFVALLEKKRDDAAAFVIAQKLLVRRQTENRKDFLVQLNSLLMPGQAVFWRGRSEDQRGSIIAVRESEQTVKLVVLKECDPATADMGAPDDPDAVAPDDIGNAYYHYWDNMRSISLQRLVGVGGSAAHDAAAIAGARAFLAHRDAHFGGRF